VFVGRAHCRFESGAVGVPGRWLESSPYVRCKSKSMCEQRCSIGRCHCKAPTRCTRRRQGTDRLAPLIGLGPQAQPCLQRIDKADTAILSLAYGALAVWHMGPVSSFGPGRHSLSFCIRQLHDLQLVTRACASNFNLAVAVGRHGVSAPHTTTRAILISLSSRRQCAGQTTRRCIDDGPGSRS
jgi:hypothetical protein